MAAKTVTTMGYQIPTELARTEAITQGQAEHANPLRSVAIQLSRRGVMQAKVELVNTALMALVEELFQEDGDGVTANVDPDGWIKMPLPWGRDGYKQWGLRVSEMRALNHVMRTRSQMTNSPLFVYAVDFRRWYLGAGYTRRMALVYLRQVPVSLGEWRTSWRSVSSKWAGKNMGND